MEGKEMKIYIIGLRDEKVHGEKRHYITLDDINGMVCDGDRKKEQPISDAILKAKGLL